MKKTTFVFSHLEDFVVFVVPLIVAFTVQDFFSAHFRALAYMFLFKTVIQGGHLFLSAFPYMESKDDRFKFYAAAYVGIYIVINLISVDYFYNVFSVASLFHIVNQHYGWYRKSESDGSFWGKENLLKYTAFGIIIVWLLNLFPASPGYVFQFKVFDFVKDIYQIPLSIRLGLVAIVFGIISYLVFVRKNIIDRPFFFIGTFGWITSGVLLENPESNYFFSVYAVISHGLGYTLFMMRKWPKKLNTPGLSYNRKSLLLVTAGVLGYIHILLFTPVKDYFGSHLIAIAWIPSIIHFAADSYLWRSKKTAAIISAPDAVTSTINPGIAMDTRGTIRT